MSAFTVTCPDGEQRHDGVFLTRAEAFQFAEWGHCCLAGRAHNIMEHDVALERRVVCRNRLPEGVQS